jgi:hypothetical protein
MKKLFFIGIFSLITLSSSAQVKNLKDLILLSELSVYELVENLQYSWNLSQPNQQFSDDKTEVTERHTYTFKTEVGTQVLQRVITRNLNTDEIYETTGLVYNDLILLKLIKAQLSSQGFVKQKDSTYSDGRTKITLYEEATDEIMLAKGYFMILIE